MYISICILFVSAALFEYCSIIGMLRYPINHHPLDSAKERLIKKRRVKKNRLSRAGFIDMCSMVIFAMFFAHFNVNYFVIANTNM